MAAPAHARAVAGRHFVRGIVSQIDAYDEFIAACQVVYHGAARTAELTRYLVLLVMFSRAAVEPLADRKIKMEAIFHWAMGDVPTTRGKAVHLGAALRVSHFLFSHGQYMVAYVLTATSRSTVSSTAQRRCWWMMGCSRGCWSS